MSATKVGASIYVNGSPNTMSSITSDINDNTWIEESPAGTFTIKNKILSIKDGGVATLGNSGDFSIAEKLVLTPTASTQCRLDIDKGGEFQMFGAAEIDGNSATPSFYQRWRWSGKFYCRGNATYTPHIYHTYIIWRYRNSFSGDGDDRNHDIMDIDYLEVDTPWSAASKWTQPTTGRVFADYGLENIKHATFGKVGDPAWRVCETTQSQSRQCGDDASKITWEDCIFYGMGTAFYLNPYHFHFKNCQFLQSTSFAVVVSQPFTPSGIARTEKALYRDFTGQLYVFLEGCTFTPVYAHDVQATNAGGILVKDSTFNGATYNIQCSDGGRVLIWTGNTFNGSIPLYLSGANSMIFYVHALDLLVEDDDTGDPIEGATIYIRQKDGKESWTFHTDANGKPINMAALEGKIMLVNKEQLDNVPNYTLWSDAGNSTYHEVWIFKEGYEPQKRQFIMSADHQETFELRSALTPPDVRDNIPFAFGQEGELDLPVIADVEKGVQYDSTTKTGTLKVPAVEDVREGEGYGAGDVEFTGELDLPIINDVRDGVKYDSETKTGDLNLPAEGDVRNEIEYGGGGDEFVGTVKVPGKADVREGIAVDVSDVGLLDLPVIADVEKDVQYDNETKTGTFKAPTEAQVEKDVGFGAAGTEFIGTMVRRVVWKADAVGKLQQRVSIKGIFQEGG